MYKHYDKHEITKSVLDSIKIGDSVKINMWKSPFKCVENSDNFIILIKHKKDSYLYSIVEKFKRGYSHNVCYKPDCGFYEDEFVCGKDNYVFGRYDFDDKDERLEALNALEKTYREREIARQKGEYFIPYHEYEVSQKYGMGIYSIDIQSTGK